MGADALFAMKQAEREATVPLSCHPHTATKTKESVGVWSRFTAVRRAQRKQTPRLASDSGSEFDSLEEADDVSVLNAGVVADKMHLSTKTHAELERALVTELEGVVANEQLTGKRARAKNSTTTVRTKRKTTLAKSFVVHKLLPLLVDINSASERVPTKYTGSEVEASYNSLCEDNELLSSVTTRNLFKLSQFKKCLNVRFPETVTANINIRYT